MMRVTKDVEPVRLGEKHGELERFRLEVTALNRRIDELKKSGQAEGSEFETLKASARVLARQIDELRCSRATDELSELLRK